jgi:hypothetical protein
MALAQDVAKRTRPTPLNLVDARRGRSWTRRTVSTSMSGTVLTWGPHSPVGSSSTLGRRRGINNATPAAVCRGSVRIAEELRQ